MAEVQFSKPEKTVPILGTALDIFGMGFVFSVSLNCIPFAKIKHRCGSLVLLREIEILQAWGIRAVLLATTNPTGSEATAAHILITSYVTILVGSRAGLYRD